MILQPFFDNKLKSQMNLDIISLQPEINLYILPSHTVDIEKYTHLNFFTNFELATINKRKKHSAKQEYIISRYIIKHALSFSLNCQLNQIETRFNERISRLEVIYNGQPLKTSISISHSKGMVCVAISQTESIFGIDLEYINQKRPFVKLANHFYHENEIKLISNSEQSHDIFYRIWTLKEALAKTIRQPISQLLSVNVFDEIQKRQLYTISCQYQGFDISLINKKPLNNVVIKTLKIPLSFE